MALAILVFSLAFGIVAWVVSREEPGSSSAPGNTSFEALRKVPVPEMPALAIDLVQATDAAGRDAKIQEVIKSVGVLARPGILPYLVGSLAEHFPANLETILGTAIDLKPELVLLCVQVAGQRQPAQIETISYIAGKKSPWNATQIAQTLAEETRDLDAITHGLKRGIPEYQPAVDDATANTNGFVAVPGPRPPAASPGTNSVVPARPEAPAAPSARQN